MRRIIMQNPLTRSSLPQKEKPRLGLLKIRIRDVKQRKERQPPAKRRRSPAAPPVLQVPVPILVRTRVHLIQGKKIAVQKLAHPILRKARVNPAKHPKSVRK
jgi:hypothetical protein